MDEFYTVISLLPQWLAAPLGQMPEDTAARIHEIRLRRGCPPFFTIDGVQVPAAVSNTIDVPTLSGDRRQMEEILFSLCGGSVHAHEKELSCGYFTLPGGHRVGVGGRYISKPNGNTVLQSVDSLNIRIARCIFCRIPPHIQENLKTGFCGLLISGEPDSGKTTVLRSILPILDRAERSAVIVDERGELLPEKMRNSRFLNAGRFDIVSGIEKQTGIQMALRTLSPQVILVDELGTLAETQLLEQGFFSGVDYIASIHAASIAEAEQKPQVRYLLSHGMLRMICQLAGRKTPGVVKEEKFYC